MLGMRRPSSARSGISTSLVVLIVISLIAVGGVAFLLGQNAFKAGNNNVGGTNESQSRTIQQTATTQTNSMSLAASSSSQGRPATSSSGSATHTTTGTISSQTSSAKTTQVTSSGQASTASAPSTITLESGELVSGVMTNSVNTANSTGSPYVSLTLYDPIGKTTVTSFGLTVTGFGESATAAYCAQGKGGACNALSVYTPTLATDSTTTITFYFYGSGNITSGQSYQYLINFADGQFFSGNMTAQ